MIILPMSTFKMPHTNALLRAF